MQSYHTRETSLAMSGLGLERGSEHPVWRPTDCRCGTVCLDHVGSHLPDARRNQSERRRQQPTVGGQRPPRRRDWLPADSTIPQERPKRSIGQCRGTFAEPNAPRGEVTYVVDEPTVPIERDEWTDLKS